MLGVIGIIISLGLLMYLAYRGISVLILAPILALFAAFISGAPLMATYTHVFMPALAGYLKTYFPIFMLGAIFGKVLEESGAAKSIAHTITSKIGKNNAILAVVLSCGILTYGGVSLFVVAFAVYPIAAHLYRESNIPKRLIPGTIALGSFTFTMTALPGTPQVQNAIPMPFFGTTVYAAPVLGIICGALIFTLGMLWLTKRAKKAAAAGEGYGYHPKENIKEIDTTNMPNFWLSLAPILIVLVLNFIIVTYILTPDSTGYAYLVEKYSTNIKAVRGIWSLIICLVVAILFAIIFIALPRLGSNEKSEVSNANGDDNSSDGGNGGSITATQVKVTARERLKEVINNGAMGAMLPILNTSCEVGYGNVIKSLSAFAIVQAAMLGLSDNPLISAALATNVLAGITGSASGGMSIALGAMGDQFMQMAAARGISPEVLHRVVTLACGGLDTLPHNGAVITLLGITGLTHKESYADIGVVASVIPILVAVVAIILGTLGVV